MTNETATDGRTLRIAMAGLLLASCLAQASSAQVRTRPDSSVSPLERPRPATNTIARRALDVRVGELGHNFNGSVGIAVEEIDTGWRTSWNGDQHFPQQSVSKFWVALTAFSRIDAGDLRPDSSITIRRQDLTLFHQPVAAQVGANGYTTTLDNLIFRAITQSDNTCNDAVLRSAGGPEAVRAMLADNQIEGIRFGPGERLMQSQIAGLQWQPGYSVGRAFYVARNSVSEARRRAAFQRYLDDPIDGATPHGLVNGLSSLQRGQILSPRSTQRLLAIMSQTRTGRLRLTGGLAPGWRIAHKTGTGQVLGATQAGYNDIGILTSPEGRTYAVAVMIGRTSVPIPERMALMQNVTRAVIAYNDASRVFGVGAAR